MKFMKQKWTYRHRKQCYQGRNRVGQENEEFGISRHVTIYKIDRQPGPTV